MMLVEDGRYYFSTTDANFLRHQFCRRMNMGKEQFYEWIHEKSRWNSNRVIAEIITGVVPVGFAQTTVDKWVGHWVKDSKQDLEQVSIWRSL